MTNYRLGVVALLVGSALVGCGEKGGGTATVTGKVTLPDGKPLPGGRIDFRSTSSGNQVSGIIKADGTYEAKGVPQGDYKVAITNDHLKGMGPPPPSAAPMPGSDQKYVPINASYSNTESSKLTTSVSGKSHTYDVQLK